MREEFHSPLEGESKRPSGFCEGRFGGGRFSSVACPPTGAAADSVLALPTPPQGGSETSLVGRQESQGGMALPGARAFLYPPVKGGRGGWFCNGQIATCGTTPRRGCHYNGLTSSLAPPLLRLILSRRASAVSKD